MLYDNNQAEERSVVKYMSEIAWSKTEKSVARRAFDNSYRKECLSLAKTLREMADSVRGSDDIWRIHDFLTRKRVEIDEKYDYRYSVLQTVFSRLLKEGWLEESDLEGLLEEKVSRIKYLASL